MTSKKGIIISALLFYFFPIIISAQEDTNIIEIDTIINGVIIIESDTSRVADYAVITEYHSPQRAALYSAVLPGLGQAYNKQYWKIPIIYAAGAGVVYFLLQYSEEYKTYYKAWSDYYDGNDYTNSQEDLYFWNKPGIDEVSSLRKLKDNARRWRDLDYIILGGVYLANVIEANVSAHFKNYDVDEDLSFHIQPTLIPSHSNSPNLGLRISINF
ncbi:MAG: hypothetical protein JXB49_10550 [Bacteroidales bacterium]|nr:hypothetical protein [Bacteroidales bacterium]